MNLVSLGDFLKLFELLALCVKEQEGMCHSLRKSVKPEHASRENSPYKALRLDLA